MILSMVCLFFKCIW